MVASLSDLRAIVPGNLMAFSSQVRPPSRWVHVNEVQAQGTVFKFSWIFLIHLLVGCHRVSLYASDWYLDSGLQESHPWFCFSCQPITSQPGGHAAICLKAIVSSASRHLTRPPSFKLPPSLFWTIANWLSPRPSSFPLFGTQKPE